MRDGRVLGSVTELEAILGEFEPGTDFNRVGAVDGANLAALVVAGDRVAATKLTATGITPPPPVGESSNAMFCM